VEPLILWGWDPTNQQWRPLAVDSTGRLTIANITLEAARIEDADKDTYITAEASPDKDTLEGYAKGVKVFDIQSEGVQSLPKQSASRMYLSASQSIPNNTLTKITLDTTSYDVQGENLLGSNRWVAKNAGMYLAVFRVGWWANTLRAPKAIAQYLYKNGAVCSAGYLHTSMDYATIGVHGAAIAEIAASDYLELYARHWFGAAGSAEGGTQNTFLEIIKIA
jgi:hypothetical protein